jgi:hypothetical protein
MIMPLIAGRVRPSQTPIAPSADLKLELEGCWVPKSSVAIAKPTAARHHRASFLHGCIFVKCWLRCEKERG